MFDFLFKNFWRGVFRRVKRYGYAIVSFGTPISVDDFVRAHPNVVAPEFEQRKPELNELAEAVMQEISAALPVTPVTLAARIFAQSEPLTDHAIVAAMEEYRERWTDRIWLLRETSGEAMWRAAKNILELRYLIEPTQQWRSDLFEGSTAPVLEDAWRWNPSQILLRDYYANSLLTFAEVKRRGWPQRAPASCGWAGTGLTVATPISLAPMPPLR